MQNMLSAEVCSILYLSLVFAFVIESSSIDLGVGQAKIESTLFGHQAHIVRPIIRHHFLVGWRDCDQPSWACR